MSRDQLIARAAEQLEAAAPSLAATVGFGRRFDALFSVARRVLGSCPHCHAWPGQRHEAGGGPSCVGEIFHGAVEHEYAAVAEIAAVFEDLAAKYCTNRERPRRSTDLAELFAEAVARLRTLIAEKEES
ncbi:hypothetical protein [Nannocystis sp. SCPEA4]|uniref:hypothetical protein n=1 Tax=Nannocystis sp. SCPEA4 TaxID=2996787 RepID=UPI00226F55AE|nr:hypothetical protein [Nannocystis sp. SCPEA4]MCY1062164.1 hypothetical protein [Nannocystis sp. SCPEA4]